MRDRLRIILWMCVFGGALSACGVGRSEFRASPSLPTVHRATDANAPDVKGGSTDSPVATLASFEELAALGATWGLDEVTRIEAAGSQPVPVLQAEADRCLRVVFVASATTGLMLEDEAGHALVRRKRDRASKEARGGSEPTPVTIGVEPVDGPVCVRAGTRVQARFVDPNAAVGVRLVIFASAARP